MAKLQSMTISRRTVDALRAGKDTVFWDSELSGFGVRVYPSGVKMYVVQTRARGKSTRVTVGRNGVLTAEEARRRAALIIARVKAGKDPVPDPMTPKPAPGPTVADLAERYRREHLEVRCKQKTAETARVAIERHILPALGVLPLTEIGRDQVMALHGGLSETPAMANLTVDVLSRMFTMAEAWGMVPDGSNPCREIVKYRARKRERFLTDGEFKRLGRVLGEAVSEGKVSVHAAAAIRLLMLTGCRCNEILTLRWQDMDLGANEMRLRDSKTGPRAVPLSPAAVRVLADLPRVPGNPWVIAGRVKGMHMKNLGGPWGIVRARADLKDVRIHDLRHSFASRALALGESLPMSASPSVSATRAACILSGRRDCENSANARENVASLGISATRDQPHSRRNVGSTLSLSIRWRVVGRPHTALAMTPRASAWRSSRGRPGPVHTSSTKPSTLTRSRAVTKRLCVSRRGPTASANAGKRSP